MIAPEVYPNNFRQKIGFDEVCQLLSALCSGQLGRGLVEGLQADTEQSAIQLALDEAGEMLAVLRAGQSIPSLNLADCREALHRIRPDRTYLEEAELLDLVQMLDALHALHRFFTQEHTTGTIEDDSLAYEYPRLGARLKRAPVFPKIEQNIRLLFDREGRIKDNASRELLRIRRELMETERSLSGTLQRILRAARTEGWVEADVQPALRDGRLVIPVSPQHKRKIKGIVHDESGTGKTVYVEPVELVEANNRIRELEGEERREVVRILTEVASKIRPNINHLLSAYELVAHLDLVLAKARWAVEVEGLCPRVDAQPCLEWYGARHPLLQRSLRSSGREIVPLDIKLSPDEGRILIISGPNAGGKSVCLKTVGLLQYMLQCGIPVPMGDHSRVGIFKHFFIDIGDEQSIEDDLSTYSSHLSNMKHFERHSDATTLLLIDEFGGGTEPTIGGAIAQALLERFNAEGAYGVITTHYQNLKTFAEDTPGLVNGAMLYDRHHLQPLFRLSIGRPGSSFAIEIARKIGLSEAVIARASEYVGSDYIDMDKYLQDIIRDKRYWEQKRLNIRKEEKKLQDAAERYSLEADETQRARRAVLAEAKKEAERIVQEANSRIERTIREIKEAEAERERTLSLRAELKSYQDSLQEVEQEDLQASERAKREVEKLLRRRERKAKGESKKGQSVGLGLRAASEQAREHRLQDKARSLQEGDLVRLEGQRSLGTVLSVDKREAVVALGMLKMTVPLDRLHLASEEEIKQAGQSLKSPVRSTSAGKSVIDQIHEKRLHFKQDLDLRGLRASEAIDATAYFIDDALQLGMSRVRILHGTGTGALREAVRGYLSGVPGVRRYADEHVQLGGAGITVVDLD